MASFILEVLIDPQPKPENTECSTADPEGYWFYPSADYPNVDDWDLRFPPVEGMQPARNKHGEWVWQSKLTIGGN